MRSISVMKCCAIASVCIKKYVFVVIAVGLVGVIQTSAYGHFLVNDHYFVVKLAWPIKSRYRRDVLTRYRRHRIENDLGQLVL